MEMFKKIEIPPPLEVNEKKVFFSETRPYFEHFLKKRIFTIENPKKSYKIFLKMIKLLLDQQF